MTKTKTFLDTFCNVTVALVQLVKKPAVLISTGIFSYFTSYFLKYEMFIEALLVCIMADSVFGVWLSYKNKSFRWDKAIKIIEKIVVYSFYLLIVHFVSRIEFVQQFSTGINYLTSFLYSLMIINEGRSAIKNGNEVHSNKVSRILVKFFDTIEGKLSKNEIFNK